MRKYLLALGLMLCLAIAPAKAQLSPTTAQSPMSALAVYTYPVSGLMDACGPMSTGVHWEWRQALLSAFNSLFTPVLQANYHPLLDPNVGIFCSYYHKVRFWKALDTLQYAAPPGPGEVRVIQLYSSGYVLQTRTMKVVIDLAVETFNPTPLAPFLQSVEPAMLDQLALICDAIFITHSHIDHISPYGCQAFALAGKPVIVTQEIKDITIAAGFAWANQLIVPQTGVTYTVPSPNAFPGVSPETLTYSAYQGVQYMGFLDPSGTVGDPTNPYNVQCNAYLLNFSNAAQTTDVTVAHFGDNNDPGVVPWVATQAAAGWNPDIFLCRGAFSHLYSAFLSVPIQIRSAHVHEYHHFWNMGFIPYPTTPGPSATAPVLTWGESMDFQIN
jgi:hypothetical protein